MAIVEEIDSERNSEADSGAIVPMAEPRSRQGGSVSLQGNHNHSTLSVTFHRNQGVVLTLFQAPERTTTNLITFLPSSSQVEQYPEQPQTSYRPTQNNSVKMLGWNSRSNRANNRSQITKTLREMIKKAVREFKHSTSRFNLNETDLSKDEVVEAVPVSFRPPESLSLDMVLSPRKRVTTLLVGESSISFQLPHDCPFDPADFDKLVDAEKREEMDLNAVAQTTDIEPQFSLPERLGGWRMERRQRINGRFDMYYHHLLSRKTFRSVGEVVNFLMFEVYPEKPQRSALKTKLGEPGLSGKKRERKQKGVATPSPSPSPSPWKRRFDESCSWRPCEQKQQPIFYDLVDGDDDYPPTYQRPEDHKEAVEKFLAEAYQNLINGPHPQHTSNFGFDMNEEIDDGEENGGFNPNNQSVEELLAEAYDNLLNSSNNEAKLHKGKEKIAISTEEQMRKRAKTFFFTPPSSSSLPSPFGQVNSIPTELKIEKEDEKEKEKEQKKENLEKEKEKEKEKVKEKGKEKISDTVGSMEVGEAAPVATVHKRFNIKEVDGNCIFSDVDCDPIYGAASAGGGSSSAMEAAQSVALSHMDECDLMNHIPESPDMFDLAMFLSNRDPGEF